MAARVTQNALAMFEQLLAGNSLKSIGAGYGISPERVRQIVNRVRWQLVHRESRCGDVKSPAYWTIPNMRKKRHYWTKEARKLSAEYMVEDGRSAD